RGGDAEHAPSAAMGVDVAGRELPVVVLGLVDHAQADELPVDLEVPLTGDLDREAAGDPGPWADGIEEELDVGHAPEPSEVEAGRGSRVTAAGSPPPRRPARGARGRTGRAPVGRAVPHR